MSLVNHKGLHEGCCSRLMNVRCNAFVSRLGIITPHYEVGRNINWVTINSDVSHRLATSNILKIRCLRFMSEAYWILDNQNYMQFVCSLFVNYVASGTRRLTAVAWYDYWLQLLGMTTDCSCLVWPLTAVAWYDHRLQLLGMTTDCSCLVWLWLRCHCGIGLLVRRAASPAAVPVITSHSSSSSSCTYTKFVFYKSPYELTFTWWGCYSLYLI